MYRFKGDVKLKKICFITNKYPNKIDPNILVFVQQLVWTIADKGIKCVVISPMPVNINPKYFQLPYKDIEKTENGFEVEVYRPKYIGFGQSNLLGFNPSIITTNAFTNAVDRVINNMKKKPDAIYGHFVTPAGIAAARIGKKYNIDSFMAHGEATYNTINHFGKERVKKELSTLSGVVAVSSKNKKMLEDISLVDEQIIEVFPNGYRKERFYPRDKKMSREKFNLPEKKFIVGFVGSFDNRKGIQRLMEAVNELDNAYVICAGKGNLEPDGDKCLYKGVVNNIDLPFFYSAADIFVLPTLSEGCCNAIIEAMACGVPIISSDLSFNDDILDNTNSIRVDPTDNRQIKCAILKLKNDAELRKRLSKGSLEKAKELTLTKRAENIVLFIGKQCQLNKKDVV